MFKIFYPKECADSTYQIDFKSLYVRGYRGVLFDIDNTLVPHGSPADESGAVCGIKKDGISYLPDIE